jgi:hypothetical protein
LIVQLLISRPPRDEPCCEQPLIVMLCPVCMALVLSIAVCNAKNVSVEGKVCLPDTVGDRVAIFKCRAPLGTLLLDIKFALLIQSRWTLHYFDCLAKCHSKCSTALMYD